MPDVSCVSASFELHIRVLSPQVGALSFDKDDVHALDFVTAASNLRSAIFDIPRQSRWDVKEIAGHTE